MGIRLDMPFCLKYLFELDLFKNLESNQTISQALVRGNLFLIRLTKQVIFVFSKYSVGVVRLVWLRWHFIF